MRVLMVRLGAMGDVVHALPAAATLKHSFPAAELVWVIEPRWKCLLEGNPFVDRVVEFDRRSLRGIRQAFQQLRSRRTELGIDFQGLVKSALVASAARPDRLYGYHRGQAREPLAAWFYSHPTRTRAAHIVDQHLELAAAAGARNRIVEFPLPPGRLEEPLPEGPFVLASPLAGWESKQWPLEHYSVLAGRLYRELGVPLVVNGAPDAVDTLRRIDTAQIHVSSIEGLIDATRRASAVVGVDSGPLHLAAALLKPGVAIFGPTDPARNGPYGGSLQVLRSAEAPTTYKRAKTVDPSMAAITPAEVFERLRDLLRNPAAAPPARKGIHPQA